MSAEEKTEEVETVLSVLRAAWADKDAPGMRVIAMNTRLSPSTVHNVMTGRSFPRLIVAEAIGKYLGADAAKLRDLWKAENTPRSLALAGRLAKRAEAVDRLIERLDRLSDQMERFIIAYEKGSNAS